jgi:hypothetical protein
MAVPKIGEIEVGCIVCGTPLKPRRQSMGRPADRGMWVGAVVDSITGGFGSRHDGHAFLVGVCDGCVDEAVATGRMIRYPLDLIKGPHL